MLEFLRTHMDLLTVLWLFPIVFMFHDFEEILTVKKWTRSNRQKVASLIPKWFPQWLESSFQMTTLQFSRDVLWVFSFITLSVVLAAQFSFYPLFLIFLAIFFLHVFTHLGMSLYLRSYTPGIDIAIFLDKIRRTKIGSPRKDGQPDFLHAPVSTRRHELVIVNIPKML